MRRRPVLARPKGVVGARRPHQTLRNQLVGVMRMTGTRRQSELVSLLTRLALTCL